MCAATHETHQRLLRRTGAVFFCQRLRINVSRHIALNVPQRQRWEKIAIARKVLLDEFCVSNDVLESWTFLRVFRTLPDFPSTTLNKTILRFAID
jgi:hypothetical protein